jgi:membrane fusion protein, heavy metal efflux system
MSLNQSRSYWKHLNSCLLAWGIVIALTACGDPESETAHKENHGHESNLLAAHSHETAGVTCFVCDPSKREKGRLWCEEHSRYEDRCWICHPELEDKSRLWCKEHSLYEDECTLCHPELKKSDTSPESSSRQSGPTSSELYCSEHDVPERECGICQPGLAAALEPGQSLKVRLATEASADRAGIQVERPRRIETTPGVDAFCEADYNRNVLTRITPLTSGIVTRVYRDVGDRVEAGDPLVELHSVDVARARSSYLTAVIDLDIKKETVTRKRKLAEDRIGARKHLQQAEADFRVAQLALKNARQALLNLGLSSKEIAALERSEDASALYTLRAPFDGTLIDRAAVSGQAVVSGEALLTLADLSTRWLKLSLPADHIHDIRVGQHVSVVFDDLPDEVVHGELVWVDAAVDPQTRLIRARAVTADVHRMKTGMFGRARVSTGERRPGVIVPSGAVQYHEKNPYVFVRQAPDLFALRRVTVGATRSDLTELLSGVSPDEAVVGTGFLVMSEFLKSRLGAGCVDH